MNAWPTARLVLLWSSGAIFSRWGLDDASPFVLLALRFGVALVFLWLLGWRERRWLPEPGTRAQVAGTGLLLVGGYSCAYFLALDQGLTPGELATILGVQPKVAIQQPLEACAHGVAVHGAHHQLGAAHQRARDALHVFAHLRPAGRRGGLIVEGFQIIASAKRAAGAGQHDGARGGVGLSSLQLRVQIAQQIGVDGVQPLGPLQRDDADGAIGLQADGASGWWRGAHAVDYRHSPYDQAINIRRRP